MQYNVVMSKPSVVWKRQLLELFEVCNSQKLVYVKTNFCCIFCFSVGAQELVQLLLKSWELVSVMFACLSFHIPQNDLLKSSHLTLCSLTCTLKWVVLFRTNCTVEKVMSLLFLKCPVVFNSLGWTRWVETYEGAVKEGVSSRKKKFGAETTLFSCGAARLVHAREDLVLVNGSNVTRLL